MPKYSKRRQYVPATKYTADELERARLGDLLNDARACLRFVRELDRGANPKHYGCTREEYLTSATQSRIEVRRARGKTAATTL